MHLVIQSLRPEVVCSACGCVTVRLYCYLYCECKCVPMHLRPHQKTAYLCMKCFVQVFTLFFSFAWYVESTWNVISSADITQYVAQSDASMNIAFTFFIRKWHLKAKYKHLVRVFELYWIVLYWLVFRFWQLGTLLLLKYNITVVEMQHMVYLTVNCISLIRDM